MERKTYLIFSQRIRKLRNIKRISQEKTADFLNVSRGYYGSIERGDQYPRLDVLFHLAQLFELPLHQLLYFESHQDREESLIREKTFPYSSFEQWFSKLSLEEQQFLYALFTHAKKLMLK